MDYSSYIEGISEKGRNGKSVGKAHEKVYELID